MSVSAGHYSLRLLVGADLAALSLSTAVATGTFPGAPPAPAPSGPADATVPAAPPRALALPAYALAQFALPAALASVAVLPLDLPKQGVDDSSSQQQPPPRALAFMHPDWAEVAAGAARRFPHPQSEVALLLADPAPSLAPLVLSAREWQDRFFLPAGQGTAAAVQAPRGLAEALALRADGARFALAATDAGADAGGGGGGIAAIANAERACDAGFYCERGVRIACPPGTYNGARGARARAQCLPCWAGHFCPQASVAPTRCGAPNVYCPGAAVDNVDSVAPPAAAAAAVDAAAAAADAAASAAAAASRDEAAAAAALALATARAATAASVAAAAAANANAPASMVARTQAASDAAAAEARAAAIEREGAAGRAEAAAAAAASASAAARAAASALAASQAEGDGGGTLVGDAAPRAVPAGYYSVVGGRQLPAAWPRPPEDAKGLDSPGGGAFTDDPPDGPGGRVLSGGGGRGGAAADYVTFAAAFGTPSGSPSQTPLLETQIDVALRSTDVDARTAVRMCPPGTYCVDGVAALCPGGVFGATPGLTSPACSGPCERGYYCERASASGRVRAEPALTESIAERHAHRPRSASSALPSPAQAPRAACRRCSTGASTRASTALPAPRSPRARRTAPTRWAAARPRTAAACRP